MHNAILTLILICATFYQNNVQAQNGLIIAVNDSGELVEINPSTCQWTLLSNCGINVLSIAYFNDFIYLVDYYSNLYRIGYNDNNCIFLGQFQEPLGSYNAMTANSDGVIFVVESGTNQLEAYDINTGLFSVVGIIPYAYVSGGDLAFINNSLVLATSSGSLVNLNLSNLAGSSILMSHNLNDVFGLGSYSQNCQYIIYYLTSTDSQTNTTSFIQFIPQAGALFTPPFCTVPFSIFDTASTTEGGQLLTTPIFDQIEPICINDIIDPLPTISNNGISGSWSPAFNNQETTTYTFTPYSNQCASIVQMTISVMPMITPSFDFPLTQCLDADLPDLPTISLNGIVGTWTPALNNQQTTSYTFTPSGIGLEQCAQATQLTIQVDPIQSPNFTQLATFCQGASIPLLPTTSSNGINGTWSPPINNQETTTYTFTPNSGECAESLIMTIEIDSYETPIFDLLGPFCQGETISDLPTTSLNDINGTWFPAINNQRTMIYTFVPTTPGCFNSALLTLEILPLIVSDNLILACANELPYAWNGQNLVETGSYTAFFNASNGCDSIANLSFFVLPILQSDNVLNICENQIPYIWNGLSIMESGIYSVSLTSSLGCDSLARLEAIIRPIPSVFFEADALSDCGQLATNFSNLTYEESFEHAQWDFGDGTFSDDPQMVNKVYNLPGCYDVTLTLTTSFGCSNQISKPNYICVYPNPKAAFLVNPNPLTEFENTANFINLSTNTNAQTWDFGHNGATSSDFSPSHSYPIDKPGFFTVWLFVSNEFSCTDSTTQEVVVSLNPIYYVPNTFTPDGDSFNNVFLPIFTTAVNLLDYNLLIFNRWGQTLFESNDVSVGWDGSYGGKIVQDGVYIYQIKFNEKFNGNRHIVRGHVNLLR